jgi:hypothetical protein
MYIATGCVRPAEAPNPLNMTLSQSFGSDGPLWWLYGLTDGLPRPPLTQPHTKHPDSNNSGASDRGKEPPDGPLSQAMWLWHAPVKTGIFAHLPPFPHSQWEPPARIYTSFLNGAIATGMRLRRRGRPWAWAQRIALAPTSWGYRSCGATR